MATTKTSKSGRSLQFFVPGEPFPGKRTNCACRGRFPTVYNPADYTAWKKQASEDIAARIPPGLSPTSAAVTLSAEFVATPPKTTKLPRPKPDVDNYLKALMDAITQSGAVWDDDTQVARLGDVEKRWAKPDETPGTYVTVTYEDE